jgi:hypothetical protein
MAGHGEEEQPVYEISIPDQFIERRIYLVRDHRVMLDEDLAELYGVANETTQRAGCPEP